MSPAIKIPGTENNVRFIFFHPDYTVGTGISPVHAHVALADFTAGGELLFREEVGGSRFALPLKD